MNQICDEDNIDSCLKMVCNNLETAGIPVWNYDIGNEKSALVFAINSLWTLLTTRKENVQQINEKNKVTLELKSETKRLNQLVKSLEGRESNLKVELAGIKNKLNLLEEERFGLNSQINLLKRECTKLQSASETEKKLHLKSIKDHQDLIKNLNGNIFGSQPLDSSQSYDKYREATSKCIKTLDNTVQNLLSEIAGLRCSYMTSICEINQLVNERKSKVGANVCLTVNAEDSVFQLPHSEFISVLSNNVNTLIECLRIFLNDLNNKLE